MSHEYSAIPPITMQSLKRWAKDGLLPGSFLTALLSGDYRGAILRADEHNLKALPAICIWVENEAPRLSYGSPAQVEQWAIYKRSERADQREKASA